MESSMSKKKQEGREQDPDEPADIETSAGESEGRARPAEDEVGIDLHGLREIQAGDVRKFEPLKTEPIKSPPKEVVQANLAYWLMTILAATIFIHYAVSTFIVILTRDDAADFELHYKPIGQIFNTLLPILSGLVSSAITYYFTREIQSSKEPDRPKKP
jgi:hypothetical protein